MRMRLTGHATCHQQKRNSYRILVRKPKGKMQLGRSKRRWKYNIKMGLTEISWGGMNWIHLTEDSIHMENNSLQTSLYHVVQRERQQMSHTVRHNSLVQIEISSTWHF
jgi:hypothetical protein